MQNDIAQDLQPDPYGLQASDALTSQFHGPKMYIRHDFNGERWARVVALQPPHVVCLQCDPRFQTS